MKLVNKTILISNVLKIMSRVAPGFMFNQLAKVGDKGRK